ncbi:MAG: nitroreductase family protein [Lachnospiraceae bacterium]|nr:nitroreductase family protein [Lachnospiraceae bacterium]
MELIQAMKERRSVRRFNGQPVDREVMKKIVESAVWAPSWKNSQTPRYTVIDSRELIDDIAENGCLGFEFNTKTLKQTPVLVVVSYVKGICGFEKDGSYTTGKKDSWQMFDAGIAAQTFVLAAHEQGVGTVMLGIYDGDYVGEKIGLPDDQEVAVLIAAGYEKFRPDAPGRKSAEEVMRFL